jgi:hypothetical protein
MCFNFWLTRWEQFAHFPVLRPTFAPAPTPVNGRSRDKRGVCRLHSLRFRAPSFPTYFFHITPHFLPRRVICSVCAMVITRRCPLPMPRLRVGCVPALTARSSCLCIAAAVLLRGQSAAAPCLTTVPAVSGLFVQVTAALPQLARLSRPKLLRWGTRTPISCFGM